MSRLDQYPENWKEVAEEVKDRAHWQCVRCDHIHERETWHILTVHHFDGDKRNCEWWNLLALCQRCHLKVQAKFDWSNVTQKNCPKWLMLYLMGRILHVNLNYSIPYSDALVLLDWFDDLYENVWDELKHSQTTQINMEL